MEKIAQSLNKITTAVGNNTRGSVVIKQEVGSKINKSMDMWNSMMSTLQGKAMPEQPAQPSNQSSRMSFNPMMQSNMSFASVNVKDDARDLLERYSEILVEQIKAKLPK